WSCMRLSRMSWRSYAVSDPGRSAPGAVVNMMCAVNMCSRARLRHGVIAAATPGVTARNPSRPQPDPAYWPMQPYRLLGIGRAGGVIAAGGAEPGRDRELVTLERPYQAARYWAGHAHGTIFSRFSAALRS